MPAPVANDSVRMASETIEFDERKDGSWKVEARYVFENTTDEKVTLQMGYPETKGNHGGSHFRGLETRVRGKKVALQTKKSGQMKGSAKKPFKQYRLGRVHLFSVDFKPKETVEIEHSFRMGSSGSVSVACQRELSYITRTGRLWKGPIGKARFVVSTNHVFDAIAFPKEYQLESYDRHVIRKGSITGSKLVLEVENWTPKEDLQIILMGRCGEGAVTGFYTGDTCPNDDWREIRKLVKAREKGEPSEAAERKYLEKFDAKQLRLCRNMVYAKYGYPFQSKKLRRRFYRHEPGAIDRYPPQYCDRKLEGEEPGEEKSYPAYCRKMRMILYTPEEGFSPNMLSRREMLYVRMLRDEERRRARQERESEAADEKSDDDKESDDDKSDE
jgi:hypothetical protein